MNSNITLSRASLEHINGMVHVSKESLSIPWSYTSFEEEFSNKTARYVVALDGQNVVGFAGIWIIAGEGDITNIAVLKEYRGMGIASSMMKELFSICLNEGADSITLEVRASNIPAQKLYEKFNFKCEGIRKGFYSDNKEDALIMWNRNIKAF